MMKTADYKRGYDAGYKQALLDALKQSNAPYKQGNYPHTLGD